MSCFSWIRLSPVQFPIPRASLPTWPSLPNFTLANWNPSSTQSSWRSSSFSLFCPNPFNHAPPQVLDIPNHMGSLAIINLYSDHNTLWVKHATHQKSESLKATSLSNLDNTVTNNSIFNTKYAEFFKKMVGAPSFSQPYLCIQPLLQSPEKICSSISVNFHLPIHALLFDKFILTIPANTPCLNNSAFFTSVILSTNIPAICTLYIFPTSVIYPIQAVSLDQEAMGSCEKWHCFNFSLPHQSMDSDNRIVCYYHTTYSF